MKVHFLSDSPRSNSGFSVVTKNLAVGLKKLGHEVSISGFQNTFIDWYNGIKVLPMATGTDEILQLQKNIMSAEVDILIYVNDAYTDARKFLGVFPKTVTYCPIEGLGIPKHMVDNLNRVVNNGGRVVAQCSYGFEEMKKVGILVDRYIYHGYNPDVFCPINRNNIGLKSKYCYFSTEVGRNNLCQEVLGEYCCYTCKLPALKESSEVGCKYYKEETVIMSSYDNTRKEWIQIEGVPISKIGDKIRGDNSKKFVFLFVGANHMLRKKIERLLDAYSLVVRESKQIADRVMLHLHCDPLSPTGIDLLEVCNRLGEKVQNGVTFSYGNWSEQALNILYNIADCHVSATASEGFGLGHLESIACGTPQIAPDNTSMTELIGNDINGGKNRGLLAKISDWYMIQDLSQRALVDINDLAIKMKLMYSDKNMREKCSANSINFAVSYTWDKICLEWNELLRSMKV